VIRDLKLDVLAFLPEPTAFPFLMPSALRSCSQTSFSFRLPPAHFQLLTYRSVGVFLFPPPKG
jgi:hypothetical protein